MSRIYDNITRGACRRSVSAGLVSLLEVEYEPHTRFEPHAHRTGNITLVLSGSVREVVAEDEHVARSCSVVIKPAGTIHANTYGPQRSRALVLELDDDVLAAVGAPRGLLARFRVCHSVRAAAAVIRLHGLLAEPGREHRGVLAEELRLLHTALDDDDERSAVSGATGWLELARSHLHDRRPLPFADIAHSLGVHPVYLARAFRRRYRCTMGEYQQHVRILDAAERLSCSDEPLVEVALTTGFSDQSHFTRIFRRSLGIPPGRFRRLAQVG
jgi:AraC family transcriptional regulator